MPIDKYIIRALNNEKLMTLSQELVYHVTRVATLQYELLS